MKFFMRRKKLEEWFVWEDGDHQNSFVKNLPQMAHSARRRKTLVKRC